MRIGINLLFLYEITGIGVYITNILENLGKIDQENQYIIFINQEIKNKICLYPHNFRYVKLPFKASNRLTRIFYEQIILPFLCLIYKIDVLFNPNIFNPLFSFCKEITVIYDLLPYLSKDKELRLKYIQFNIKNAIKKSDRIITISEFSKEEINQVFPKALSKISVIYGSVPPLPSLDFTAEKEILQKFEIKKPYFFYIGLITPHKNIENLIKAFYFFSKKHPGFELVLAGRIAKDLIDPYKIIAELNLQNKVRLIGYITEEEKSVLYKYAKAFVFVSTHEGFGFPILEAQSLGVPVLTSNTSSLPEIAGDGALFVNPFDIEEISKGMEKIVFDENLRKDLIQKGYENIKRFSWRKAAEELLGIFKEVKSS